MGDHTVNLILEILIFCKDLPLLYLLDDAAHKRESLSVCSLHLSFIFQIDVCLHIGSILSHPLKSRSLGQNFLQILMS